MEPVSCSPAGQQPPPQGVYGQPPPAGAPPNLYAPPPAGAPPPPGTYGGPPMGAPPPGSPPPSQPPSAMGVPMSYNDPNMQQQQPPPIMMAPQQPVMSNAYGGQLQQPLLVADPQSGLMLPAPVIPPTVSVGNPIDTILVEPPSSAKWIALLVLVILISQIITAIAEVPSRPWYAIFPIILAVGLFFVLRVIRKSEIVINKQTKKLDSTKTTCFFMKSTFSCNLTELGNCANKSLGYGQWQVITLTTQMGTELELEMVPSRSLLVMKKNDWETYIKSIMDLVRGVHPGPPPPAAGGPPPHAF